MEDLTGVTARYRSLDPFLDERTRRLLAAAESEALGHGGISTISKVIGISRVAIRRGLAELRMAPAVPLGRVRLPGGGRKKLVDKDPTLKSDLEALLESTTLADPEAPLRWTTQSTRQLAVELAKRNHTVSHHAVAGILRQLGYGLQANRKTREAANHRDRTAQFAYLNSKARSFLAQRQPVIFVDMKSKESVGDSKGPSKKVPDQGLGPVTPYALQDVIGDRAWVSVGMDHHTAEFAVETIWRWWRTMGQQTYSGARSLLIAADAAGSSDSRLRLWQEELQKLAGESSLNIAVCHFPPGTTKWSRVEHRLFACISQNWRTKPSRNLAAIVDVIAPTNANKYARESAHLDFARDSPEGIKVPDRFRSDWNYEFHPRGE